MRPRIPGQARTLLAWVLLFAAAVGAAASTAGDTSITVRKAGAARVISARFALAESLSVVRSVLTDYDDIPRFMPGVRTSRVLERRGGHVLLEQDSVARFLFFSRRVHLKLDVEEGADEIRFRDRAGTSFLQYEGSWTLSSHGGRTEVDYEVIAQPAFAVPGVVLVTLLGRNAHAMVDHLRAEVHARAALPLRPRAELAIGAEIR